MNNLTPSWGQQENNRHPLICRRTLIAFTISLTLHAGVLLYLSTKKIVIATSVAHMPPKTISVSIAGSRPPRMPSNSSKHILVSKQLIESKRTTTIPAQTIVKDNPVVASLPRAPMPTDNNAPADLMSYIKEKRRQAQALEDIAVFENAAARGPSEEEKRDAIIKRNLQQAGTNGIFEVRRMSLRTGQFSFRGWKNNYDNSRLELIEVTAEQDNNVELAIVKKMIEIIRREYQGNFRWESQRLDRVIVLSARLEDNTGLESFLMKEFFSSQNYYPHH